MKDSIKITVIICITVLILAAIPVAFYYANQNENTVTVSGMSNLEVQPDEIVVYFYLQSVKDSAQEANDAVSLMYDEMLLNVIKEGINSKDVETTSLYVNPKYEWTRDGSEFIGYEAMHSLKIKVGAEETSKVGKIVDAVIEAGAYVSYISFELSTEKQNEYKALALEEATKDARTKADAMAKGLGKKVTKVVSVSSSDFGYYPWAIYESAASQDTAVLKEATTNIQPSSQDVNARVSVVFAIR